MFNKRTNKKQSLDMFYHDEDILGSNNDNSNNNNDDDNDYDYNNELINDFSNKKEVKEFTKKKAIIHSKPSLNTSNKEKEINTQFISELSNINNNQGGDSKSNIEKKIESNLESKYGKGYKLLKLAGYKIGGGLGAKEQGITDPLEIKVRKKKTGISNEDDYENPLEHDKKNNFLLGKKRLGRDKAFEETNEEMNHFEQLIEAYTNINDNDKDKEEKDNDTLIENMLIKEKEFNKSSASSLQPSSSKAKAKIYNLYSMSNQTNIINKYIGREFNLKPILNNTNPTSNALSGMNKVKQEENKQLVIELIQKSKAKVLSYLNVYYKNKNNRIILTKLNETSNEDQIHIEDEYKLQQMFHSKLLTSNLNQITDDNISEYIQRFISLYDLYPKLFKQSYSELCLICLKQTILYYQAQYKSIADYFDSAKAKSLKANSILIKQLIEKSYNDYDYNDNDDIKRDHMFSYNKIDTSEYNTKSNTYYAFFIYEVLLRYMNDLITNQWNIKEYDRLIKFFQLYIDIIPLTLMDSISELISTKIISFIANSISFIPTRDDIFIHNWIHPWFDILNMKSIEAIELSIQRSIMNDILTWSIEDEIVNDKLLSLLSPWRNVFRSEFWDELEKRFIMPKLRFMFKTLKINPSDQSIVPFNVMFKLIEGKMVGKEKCIEVLKEEFFTKWIKTLNNWLKNGGVSKEKLNEIQQWFKGWKELITEQFKDSEEIKRQLKDGLILIYNYTKK